MPDEMGRVLLACGTCRGCGERRHDIPPPVIELSVALVPSRAMNGFLGSSKKHFVALP